MTRPSRLTIVLMLLSFAVLSFAFSLDIKMPWNFVGAAIVIVLVELIRVALSSPRPRRNND